MEIHPWLIATMYRPGNFQLLRPVSSTAVPLFIEPTQARNVLQSLPLVKNILLHLLQFSSIARSFGQERPTLAFYTLSSRIGDLDLC